MRKSDPSLNIPTGASESQDWIQWHKDLKKLFGKKKANSVWTYAWSKRGGVDARANDRTLSNYMEKEGVDITRTSLAELSEGVLDFGSDIMTTSKWIWIISVGAISLILFRILWGLSKNPNQTLGQVADVHPATRGARAINKGR
jgi:hypothetical protein